MKNFFTSIKYRFKLLPSKGKFMYLLMCFLAGSLNVSFGQLQVRHDQNQLQEPINLQVENQSLVFVLDKLEQQSGYVFIYSNDVVDAFQHISLQAKNRSLDKVLKELLAPQGITYQLFGKQIVLTTKDELKKIEKKSGTLEEKRSEDHQQGSISKISGYSNAIVKFIRQQKTVTGVVTSQEDGEPLPGVNIVIFGTTRGTVTDINGEYSLEIPEGDVTLVFSSVGFNSEEVQVNNRSVIDMVMLPDIQRLQELVVVGYGTNVKRDVTGAISSVKGEDIDQLPTTSIDQALQGRAAGIQVAQSSGVPGAATRILVRGTSSISAGTEPLIIVDGFPIFQDVNGLTGGLNPLSAINPKDIESIEVLKDAAATAIYGSRGANGVIIITTKTGKKGVGNTTVDYSYGVTSPTNMVDLVDAQTWLQLTDEAWANDGRTTTWDPFQNGNLVSDNADPSELTREMVEQIAAEGGTDWLDPIFRNGSMQQLTLSSSRGFDNGQFYLSGNYRKEQGMLEGMEFDRFGVKANLDFNPIDKLKTGIRSNFTYITNNQTTQLGQGSATGGGRNDKGSAGGYASAIGKSLPIMPIYSRINPDRFWDPLGGLNTVVASYRSNKFTDQTEYRTITNGFLEYEILEGLVIRGEASIDFIHSKHHRWTGDVLRYSPMAYETSRELWNRNFQAYLTYNNTFGDHDINAVVGAERQARRLYRRDNMAEGLESGDGHLGEPTIIYTDENGDKQTNVLVFVNGTFPEYRISSYFSRMNYKFKDRYLIGASFRVDGSSSFGSENRFGTFPALSAGWIITEEDWASNLRLFNFLKLRASYGKVGNADIGDPLNDYYAVWPGYIGSAVKLDRIGVPDITWENISNYDFGIDLGMFDNRITGSLGFYQQNVSDMLLQTPLPPSQGVGSVWANVGEISNWGFEIQLSSVNLNVNDFKWSTDVNFSTNRNEVIQLSQDLDANTMGVISSNGKTASRIGGRLGTFYLPSFAGLNENGDPMIYVRDPEVYNTEGRTVRMKDQNGNDSTMLAGNQNNANRFYLEGKTGLPTYYGGINNTFAYKGVELSVFFTFQGGNYIYDDYGRNQLDATGNTVIRQDLVGNYWTENNRDAEYARLSYDGRNYDQSANVNTQTDQFLYKGDFLRLRTLQLAYNLPVTMLKNSFIKNARIYVNANNVLTITGYPGYDPEVVNLDGNAENRNLQQGWISDAGFPQTKSFNAGVKVTF